MIETDVYGLTIESLSQAIRFKMLNHSVMRKQVAVIFV